MPEPARKYTQVTKAVYERPWAITEPMLRSFEEIIRLRLAGSALTDEQIEARIASASRGPRRGPQRAQGVAVIPIYGVISQRMSLMAAMSGGTSVEGITQDFREAQADPDIGAIVFDVDSPGGSVEGIDELAAEIRAARGGKPMAMVANAETASAAYYIGAAADEVIVTPSGRIGSIGIIAMRPDRSAADEKEGVKYHVITAGGGKGTWNEHVPLSNEGRDEILEMANDYYGMFVSAVAASRGVSAEKVTDDWQARMFTARKAVAAGLADRVDTLDATVRRLVVEANRAGPAAMHALAAAGLTAREQIGVLMSTMPINEQAALWTSERDRIAAHFDEKARLRALEGRSLSAEAREHRDALTPLPSGIDDTDLDTDEPEEAAPTQAAGDWRGRARLELLEAATRGGYSLPPIEVPQP